MWLDEADGFAELFKGYLPYYLLVALPIFIIMSPVNPVAASHEFSVYRMQQYDLHTVPHGCRSASISLEGRSLTAWSTSRHCIIARIQDITIDQFMQIKSKGGALLLILPNNDTALTIEEKDHIQLLEMAMSQEEITAPVYLMKWTPEVDDILKDLRYSFITDDKSSTALEAMINTVSSNGYQIVVTSSSPQKIESKAVTLHGKLLGRSGSSQTIIVAAHYDSSAIGPELAVGADSNASGVIALLELARVFSRLYSSAATRGIPTIYFVLTGTGHILNYFSAKKWLEDHVDSAEGSALQDVSFAMCLDSISSSLNLMMHVSKPPKPGGAAHSIQSRVVMPVTHKKINLADEVLAWQHERFSIKRMSAFTISSLQSHKDPSRSSILDIGSEKQIGNLIVNIRRLAQGLASHVYNLTKEEQIEEDFKLYNDALAVDEIAIRHWYKYLTSQPRAPQLMSHTTTAAGISAALEKVLSRYLGDVTVSAHSPDKREPEYTLYGPTRAVLNVYSVKPAVFDLILTLGIAAYLALVYFVIQLFPRFYEEIAKFTAAKTKIQ